MANLTPTKVSGFNINQFLAQIATKGIVKTNRFQAYFMIPNGFNGATNITPNPTQYARQFVCWCDSVTLPDITFDVMEYQRYGIGVASKVARPPKFSPCQLTIIADAKGDTRNFFESWLSLVGEYSFSSSNNTNIRNPAPASYTPFCGGYPDDYVTQLYVSVYDDAGNEVTRHVFERAFPFALEASQMNWNSSQEALRFKVGFQFAYWYQQPITGASPAPPTMTA